MLLMTLCLESTGDAEATPMAIQAVLSENSNQAIPKVLLNDVRNSSFEVAEFSHCSLIRIPVQIQLVIAVD